MRGVFALLNRKSQRTGVYVTFALALALLTLLWVFMDAQLAAAHGSITVDGQLTDWCFDNLLSGIITDTRATFTCSGGVTGSEVGWRDGYDDYFDATRNIDIIGFGTTADPTDLYFAFIHNDITYPHFQIAIDVAPGQGNDTWYDPTPNITRTVGTNASGGPIAPDYLVVVAYGPSPMASLYAAAPSPGSWTEISAGTVITGSHYPVSPPRTYEIQIPWSSFTCSGCPAFGPGSTANVTYMVSRHDTVNLEPSNIEIDIISEETAGTYTTSPNSCAAGNPAGTSATKCELLDGSADGFISVSYQDPTAVSLEQFIARPVSAAMPAYFLLAISITGAALFFWRRRSTPVS